MVSLVKLLFSQPKDCSVTQIFTSLVSYPSILILETIKSSPPPKISVDQNLSVTTLFFFLKDFIYLLERVRERKAETQAEGEAGSR